MLVGVMLVGHMGTTSLGLVDERELVPNLQCGREYMLEDSVERCCLIHWLVAGTTSL